MNAMATPERGSLRVNLRDIAPNPAQPRRNFSDETLAALANSIAEHGLLSPLVVRRVGAGKYELIAGERRMRALKMLGRECAEAIIMPAYDADSAILALVENIQRDELHFLDEAAACRDILARHNISQDELARRLSRSPSALANRLRLVKLSGEVREVIIKGGLSERHARALLSADESSRLPLARECAKTGMTVRALEQKIEKSRAKKRVIKRMCRDSRLYINAIMDTVNRLEQLGARIDTNVREQADGTQITILIKPL